LPSGPPKLPAANWLGPSASKLLSLLLSLLLLLLLLLCSDLDLQRLKARRAPEDGGAEEAPLSERSEFGRRAPPAEERRGPMRSIGARRRWRFWLLLPRQK